MYTRSRLIVDIVNGAVGNCMDWIHKNDKPKYEGPLIKKVPFFVEHRIRMLTVGQFLDLYELHHRDLRRYKGKTLVEKATKWISELVELELAKLYA